jgi:predicted ferric reductase
MLKDASQRSTELTRPGGMGLATAYIILALVPLILARAQSVAPMDGWEYAAAAMGIIALLGMAVQFVTSGRFQRVSGGLGIDKIMAFHKLAALWLGVAVLLHPLVYILPTWLDDPDLGSIRLRFYLTNPAYRTGVISLGALVVLVVTSLLRDSLPWSYEAWRGGHLLLGLIAVLAGLHHARAVGRFSAGGALAWFWALVALAVLGVVAVLYGWRWWLLHRRPWRLTSVTKRADRMWELDIQPYPGTPQLNYYAG